MRSAECVGKGEKGSVAGQAGHTRACDDRKASRMLRSLPPPPPAPAPPSAVAPLACVGDDSRRDSGGEGAWEPVLVEGSEAGGSSEGEREKKTSSPVCRSM